MRNSNNILRISFARPQNKFERQTRNTYQRLKKVIIKSDYVDGKVGRNGVKSITLK
jgi:hypothetical protein